MNDGRWSANRTRFFYSFISENITDGRTTFVLWLLNELTSKCEDNSNGFKITLAMNWSRLGSRFCKFVFHINNEQSGKKMSTRLKRNPRLLCFVFAFLVACLFLTNSSARSMSQDGEKSPLKWTIGTIVINALSFLHFCFLKMSMRNEFAEHYLHISMTFTNLTQGSEQ